MTTLYAVVPKGRGLMHALGVGAQILMSFYEHDAGEMLRTHVPAARRGLYEVLPVTVGAQLEVEPCGHRDW